MDQTIDYSQIPLRDIHLPGLVPWWPPAPGWWLLLALLLGVATWYGVRYARQYRERAALRALLRVQLGLESGAEPGPYVAQLSMIMRRFAMAVAINPRLVAGLVGAAWLQYLDSRWESDAFVNGPGQSLTIAPYAPACSRDEALSLVALCIDWVRTQRSGD